MVIFFEFIVGLIWFSLENRNYFIMIVVILILIVSEFNNFNIVKVIIVENNRVLYFICLFSLFNCECLGDIFYCFRYIGIYGYLVLVLK